MHPRKQNMGIMHGIAGHTTHMDDLIGSKMQKNEASVDGLQGRKDSKKRSTPTEILISCVII